MIDIQCTTNIDEARKLRWPTQLTERPVVGDLIRSLSSTRDKHIELQVVQCTWVKDEFLNTVMKVELHLPKGRFESINAFEKFLKRS